MHKKGFTLIELLIATAIFSVVTGGGIASYNQFNQREKLKAGALRVKTYLRKAQAQAMAGVKNESAPPDGCGDQPLDGWCLDIERGYLYGHCGGPQGSANPVDFNVESFEIPDGIEIRYYAPDGSEDQQRAILLFKPLAQGVDQESTICLSSSAFGRTYYYKITVTTSGEITDHGFVPGCP